MALCYIPAPECQRPPPVPYETDIWAKIYKSSKVSKRCFPSRVNGRSCGSRLLLVGRHDDEESGGEAERDVPVAVPLVRDERAVGRGKLELGACDHERLALDLRRRAKEGHATSEQRGQKEGAAALQRLAAVAVP
eukprot:6199809-Pleurochrysis_carterae.AAC.2